MKIYTLEAIETARLIIRPVRLGDENQLNQAIVNSYDLLIQWMPWAHDPSMDASYEFVQRGVYAWGSGISHDFPMVIIHKADQKIIGGTGYNDLSNPTEGLYEIGYWCDIDYQGQGFVTECVNALTRYAFNALQAKKVVISMQSQNAKSESVAKRLHFKLEGMKVRNPLDCVSGKPESNLIYSILNLETLPLLNVTWSHADNQSGSMELISWARAILGVTDNKAFFQGKAIVKTPWSTVFELSTWNKSFYLKKTPPELYLEVEVLKKLRNQCFVTTIPEIVSENAELHCFLMRKCGDLTLRNHFNGVVQIEILKQGLDTYIQLQKATCKKSQIFMDLGVPDWRLEKFPHLYDLLISDPHFLSEHGITKKQQKQMHNASDYVKKLCEELATHPIDECLNHSDFHENNIVYDLNNQSTAIIDLGESSISHPFFSLSSFLFIVKSRYHFHEDSTEYKSLQDCSFKGWIDDEDVLIKILKIIDTLRPIYLLLTQKRFLDAIDLPYNAENLLSVKQHEKINNYFISFLKNMDYL